MRPLSAASYAILLRLNCPMITGPAADQAEQLHAATLWHYLHTAEIDAIESATDAELLSAAKRHAYTLDLAAYPGIFKAMTRDIERMKAAFVEAEPPAGTPSPLASTTATSQTSLSR